MANPKGNPETLKSFKPKWRSGKTRTIRVPIAILDSVIKDAQELDINGNIPLSQVIQELKQENKYLVELLAEKSSISNTDTSERKELLQAFEDAIAIPSNRGGQIKKAIVTIGSLLGFEINKTSKGWTISDTRG